MRDEDMPPPPPVVPGGTWLQNVQHVVKITQYVQYVCMYMNAYDILRVHVSLVNENAHMFL